MRKRPVRIRSQPLYVQAGGEVISLVAEVELSPSSNDISHKPESSRVMQPVAVYVIDKMGVRRMAVRSGRSVPTSLLLVGLLLMPLQYAFFRWWQKRQL